MISLESNIFGVMDSKSKAIYDSNRSKIREQKEKGN